MAAGVALRVIGVQLVLPTPVATGEIRQILHNKIAELCPLPYRATPATIAVRTEAIGVGLVSTLAATQ